MDHLLELEKEKIIVIRKDAPRPVLSIGIDIGIDTKIL